MSSPSAKTRSDSLKSQDYTVHAVAMGGDRKAHDANPIGHRGRPARSGIGAALRPGDSSSSGRPKSATPRAVGLSRDDRSSAMMIVVVEVEFRDEVVDWIDGLGEAEWERRWW